MILHHCPRSRHLFKPLTPWLPALESIKRRQVAYNLIHYIQSLIPFIPLPGGFHCIHNVISINQYSLFIIQPHHVYEQEIELEASLLNEKNQHTLESLTKVVRDEFSSLASQCMNLDYEIQTNRDSIRSLLESVKSIHTMVSNLTTLMSTPARTVHPLSIPRALITPRSSSQSLNRNRSVSRIHSYNRDRSRSPHRPSQSSSNPNKVRCTFCDSVVHLSRHCDVVKSLVKRLKIMPDGHCQKCFRKLGASHSPKCEPSVCRRGCTDDSQKPLRHEDYFCPKNPGLEA